MHNATKKSVTKPQKEPAAKKAKTEPTSAKKATAAKVNKKATAAPKTAAKSEEEKEKENSQLDGLFLTMYEKITDKTEKKTEQKVEHKAEKSAVQKKKKHSHKKHKHSKEITLLQLDDIQDSALAKAIQQDEVDGIIEDQTQDQQQAQTLKLLKQEREIEAAAGDSESDHLIKKVFAKEDIDTETEEAKVKKQKKYHVKQNYKPTTLKTLVSGANMDDDLTEIETNRPPSASLLQVESQVQSQV